jgi:ribose transport system ATP-binding protein
MAEAPRLEITAMSKTFGDQTVLKNLHLKIQPGEIHGLVGENGSGKSTCIKVLSGYHRADPGGTVLIDGLPLGGGGSTAARALGARFVHQDLGLIDSLPVADNLFLGSRYPSRWLTIRSREVRRRATRMLHRAGVDVDPGALVGDLSPAAKTGVAIARALREDDGGGPKLLVLDEPTATLPNSEADALIRILKSAAGTGVGVLYVTHRLDELFVLADELTVLRDGITVAKVPAAGLDRRSLVRMLVGDELEEIELASAALKSSTGRARLLVESLTSAPVVDVTLSVMAGEIVGIAGIAGSGRESLLAATFGARPRQAGQVTVDGCTVPPGRPDLAMAAGTAMLPAERKIHGGVMTLSGRENITISDVGQFWRFPLISRRRERRETTEWFERLSVRPPGGCEAPLSTFSGGNQQKILMAKWLRRSPGVLLLDEPTQGVDVGAKALLHREILTAAERGAAVLVSSSELEELVALCHRVLVMREGRVVAEIGRSDLTVSLLRSYALGMAEAA